MEIRSRWSSEIQQEFLRQTLTQSLEWTTYNLDTLHNLEIIAESPDREALATRWLEHVRYEINYRLPGVGEDEAEDRWYYQKERNAYTFVIWYFTYAVLREKLLAIPVSLWSNETFCPAIEAAEQLSDPSVVPRALQFLQKVLANGVSEESVCETLEGTPTRVATIQELCAKCIEIETELSRMWSYITQALDEIADSDDFQIEISPGEERVAVNSTGIHGVWTSDGLISEGLKTKFMQEIAVLENIPDDAKDWHPKTDKQVLDLVHPSLYCCVLGRIKEVSQPPSPESYSTVVEHMFKILGSASKVVENSFQDLSGETFSFQWIPSDVRVENDGSARILSYINNLHPVQFTSLYSSIEAIFARFVPLFERVVAAAKSDFPGPVFQAPMEYNSERLAIPDTVEPLSSSIDLEKPLKGKTVQVIVKVAEILLTPESPTYAGGSWYIEGTDTEQIVATGIYYFGCDNIRDSRLSFRVNVYEPEYEQSDDSGVAVIEDRCVVFSNVLQHKVEPFELEDPSKPGSRKILVFFLVDPELKVPSTSSIPPQQRSWIDDAQAPVLKKLRLFEFAEETVKQMASGDSITLDEAKEYRLELMEERSVKEELEWEDPDRYFSLCEH